MGATIDVLGACEMVVVMVVELVTDELTLDKQDTMGIGSVEHTAGAAKEGKGMVCCCPKYLALSWEDDGWSSHTSLSSSWNSCCFGRISS